MVNPDSASAKTKIDCQIEEYRMILDNAYFLLQDAVRSNDESVRKDFAKRANAMYEHLSNKLCLELELPFATSLERNNVSPELERVVLEYSLGKPIANSISMGVSERDYSGENGVKMVVDAGARFLLVSQTAARFCNSGATGPVADALAYVRSFYPISKMLLRSKNLDD